MDKPDLKNYISRDSLYCCRSLGVHFNTKMPLYQHEDSHLDKWYQHHHILVIGYLDWWSHHHHILVLGYLDRWSHHHHILVIGIPIPGKTVFIIETVGWSVSVTDPCLSYSTLLWAGLSQFTGGLTPCYCLTRYSGHWLHWTHGGLQQCSHMP